MNVNVHVNWFLVPGDEQCEGKPVWSPNTFTLQVKSFTKESDTKEALTAKAMDSAC